MAGDGLFENLEVRARLAATFGGRLVLHPSIGYEPSEGSEYLASRCEIGPSDNDEMLRLAFFDPMVVLVGLRTFSRPFFAPPRSWLRPPDIHALVRIGRLHAICQSYDSSPTTQLPILLGGPNALRHNFNLIFEGQLCNDDSPALSADEVWTDFTLPIDISSNIDLAHWKRMSPAERLRARPTDPEKFSSASTVWKMLMTARRKQELLNAAKKRDQELQVAEREAAQLAERRRTENRQAAEPLSEESQAAELLAAQLRELRIAEGKAERERFRARLGDSILRVVSDSGDYANRAVEYRRLPSGSILFLEFADADGHAEEDEPLHRTTFTTFGSALAATFHPSEQDPEMNTVVFELQVARSELIEAFQAAGINRTYFILDREPVGFDGEDIVHWRIAEGTELLEIENELKVIWNFHCGVETSGPWTREYYEVIGKNDDIYYYIDSGDNDGYFIKLGRFPNDEAAIAAGKAQSGMTDTERAELFASSEEGATE